MQSLDDFEPSIGSFKKIKNLKIGLILDFRDHFVFGCFLSQNLSKLSMLGVFQNPQDLLLMMGTEILKINAEMPEKIEVDAANPHLEIERMAKK